MSVQTINRQTQLPSVNLIPPEIQEARDFNRLQFGLAALVALAVAGVGAFYVQARSGEGDARAALADAQAQQQAAQRKLHGLQYVTAAKQDAAAAEATLTQARSTNVHWSDTLNDLSVSLPTNVWYTSLNIVEAAKPGTFLTSGDVPDDLAIITLQGYGRQHNDVAAWLNAMENVPAFKSQTFSSSKESLIGPTPVVQFAATVSVDKSALKPCDKPDQASEPGVC